MFVGDFPSTFLLSSDGFSAASAACIRSLSLALFFFFLCNVLPVLRFNPFSFAVAWHLSFHRGCLPDREYNAHTSLSTGVDDLGNINLSQNALRRRQVCQGFMRKGKKNCAMNGSNAQKHLLQSCFEDRCAQRPNPPKEAERRKRSRILHPNRNKRLTLTLFLRSSARLGCWLFTHTSLLKLRQFTSSCFMLFQIRSYLQTFFPFLFFFFHPFLWKKSCSLSWTGGIPSGVCRQTAVTHFIYLFILLQPAQVECHVLSVRLWSHLRAKQSAECDVLK